MDASSDYGPNNPEPIDMKDSESRLPKKDALQAASEYINHSTSQEATHDKTQLS